MQPLLTISVLISRNYEGVKRCLDSLRPILANVSSELILTDTGCGKEVRDLIEEYTDHIIDFKWVDDFSAARNAGLREAKGEWFLYVDDDEWFDDVSELVEFFNSRECDKYNVAFYVQRNYIDDKGIDYKDHNVDRIIRNVSGLHFEGRVHEAYTGVDIGQKKSLKTFVHHYGYVYNNQEEKEAKNNRNRKLLELECQDRPGDLRLKHQLVGVYKASGMYNKALQEAKDAIKIKDNSEYWDILHTDILDCYKSMKDWDSIIKEGEKFLLENLYPYDEFGVKQYMICAYWSCRQFDKICKLAPGVIDTYNDYKKNPDKYNANQLMIDEFWQEDNISKMLLFIIDSALAMENNGVIECLLNNNIEGELSIIAKVDTYKNWLVQMVTSTCARKEQIELFEKLPFNNVMSFDSVISKCIDAPAIEFHNIQFDPGFFEPEEREGFYIEPLVKNAWAAQLEMLARFDKICEENNLTYSLDWGTLLGAVRHKGFIPWDDDLDVCMMREDLMRFYEIIPNYPELEFLNPYNTPDLGIHASRLIISRDFTVDRDKLKDYHGFPFPVGIDIFNVDYVPRNKELEKEQVGLMEKVNQAANQITLMEEHDENEGEYYKTYKQYIQEIKELSNIEFEQEEPSLYELTVLYDEIQCAYSDEDADYISELPNIMIGRDYYLPKDTYKNIIRVPFENIMAPIPANYDEVLKVKYGEEYMTPQNVSGGHDYPFFNEAIRETMGKVGANSFEETKAHIEKISSGFYRQFVNRRSTPTLDYGENELNKNPNGRIQAALLETLEEVISLCEKHNIKYYYIDETTNEIDLIKSMSCDSTDIHIGMMRPDYMRFQQILQEELDPWFDYRSIYAHKDHTDMRTYVITDAYGTNDGEYEKRFHGCNDIVGIDIAAIDMVNDDDSVEELKKNVVTQLLETANSIPINPPYDDSIIAIANQWEELLQVGINMNGYLPNEFVKAADNVAMSDNNANYRRVRLSANICDGTYKLYEKTYFE